MSVQGLIVKIKYSSLMFTQMYCHKMYNIIDNCDNYHYEYQDE